MSALKRLFDDDSYNASNDDRASYTRLRGIGQPVVAPTLRPSTRTPMERVLEQTTEDDSDRIDFIEEICERTEENEGSFDFVELVVQSSHAVPTRGRRAKLRVVMPMPASGIRRRD
ncbi:MAG: hypothetical protein U0271_21905 [Polyangiaceae bacterium]